MQNNHNALRLLGVVGYLPTGGSDEAYSSMSLPDAELSAAEFLLRRLSLIYSPAPGWITTLEPVRAYIRRHCPPNPNDMCAVENWHVNLAITYGNYNPSDDEFRIGSAKLAENSANITFILRAHIKQCKDLAAMAIPVLAFSRFLCWTRPNGDLLEMLLSSGLGTLDHSTNAQCLKSLGDILHVQGRYEEARPKLEEARSEFIVIGSRLEPTRCLQSLGNILGMQGQCEEARLKLEEANSEFIIIGDPLGTTQRLRSPGDNLRLQGQYEDARLKLEEVRSQFIIIDSRLGATQCLRSLCNILQVQGQYEEARLKMGEVRSEFIIIGDRLGATQCLQCLGDMLRAQGQYEDAQLKLEEARSEFIVIGDRFGATRCLQSLGDILQMKGQYEEAQLKLEEAHSQFIIMQSAKGYPVPPKS